MAPRKRQGGKGKAPMSNSSSSKKPRGVDERIEHRAEEDRPFLRLAGPRFFDAGGEENAIVPKVVSQTVRTFYPGSYHSYRDFPKNVKETCWKDFLLYYKFPTNTDIERAKEIFGRIADKHLQDMLWKAKEAAKRDFNTDTIHNWRTRGPPSTYSWITKDHWPGLCNYWCSEEFAKKSRTNSTNRSASGEGTFSTTGSVSTAVHKFRFEKSNKRPPSTTELFDECHTSRKTGQYITQKAKETREMYDKRVVEEYGEDPSTHPQFDEKLWEEVIGPNRHGGVYGQGVLGKVRKSGSEGSDAASGAPSVQISEAELDQVAKRVTDQLLERFNSNDLVAKRVTDQLMERLSSSDEAAKLVMEQLVKRLSSDAIPKDALFKMVDKKIDKKMEKFKKNLKKKYRKKEKKNLKRALKASLALRDSGKEVGSSSEPVLSHTTDESSSDSSSDSSDDSST